MFSVKLTAKDIMSSPVVTVNENMSIEEVSDIFSSRMISGAPVVNDANEPVGVVSLNDIVRNEPRREQIISDKIAADNVLKVWTPQFSSEELNGYHLEEGDTLTARDIMTPFIYHVEAGTSAREVARILVSARIHRLFVYDGSEIVGVVSTMDILRSYLGRK